MSPHPHWQRNLLKLILVLSVILMQELASIFTPSSPSLARTRTLYLLLFSRLPATSNLWGTEIKRVSCWNSLILSLRELLLSSPLLTIFSCPLVGLLSVFIFLIIIFSRALLSLLENSKRLSLQEPLHWGEGFGEESKICCICSWYIASCRPSILTIWRGILCKIGGRLHPHIIINTIYPHPIINTIMTKEYS